MSASTQPRLPSPLRKAIDGYRRRWRAITANTGLFITLAVVAGTVGAAIAADRLLRLTPTLRAIALAAITVAGAVCLMRWVLWPALRRMRDRDAAARLGHHYPKVEEDLVSAVELSTAGLDQQGVSQSLIRSALRHIVERARSVDYRAAVPVRPMLKAGLVVLAVVAVLFIAYQLRPEAVSNALVRLFRPAAEVPYFCYTKLRVEPGDHVVRIGDSVEIVATTTGTPARVARLYGRKGDGADPADRVWARLACEEGVGRWDSGPLFKDFTYRIAAGDAISGWHRVRVVPPPSLSHKGAVLRSPDYAGGTERTIESIEGPLRVVQGTEVVIQVATTERGEEPEFLCTGTMLAGNATLPMTPNAHGLLCSEPFKPDRTDEYIITLTDGFGLRNRTPESIYVKVVPDRVPAVSIVAPGRDLFVLAHETVPVEVAAQDEFGIRDLALASRRLKQEDGETVPGRWDRHPLAEGGPDQAKLEGKADLNIGELGLVPGDILEYRAEAADYAGEALLRRGLSPVYRLVVLSEMEHLERVLTQLKKLQMEMLKRAAIQKTQAANAGRLADASQQRDVRDAARAAGDRELEEARGTEHLARKVEELIPDLARNPTTPTDMLTGMERLGRGVRSVAREEIREAADAFGRAAEGQQGQPGEGEPQEGQPGEGQPQQGQPGLQSPLRMAQRQADEAGRRLEQLAQLAERLARSTILEKLAAEAEALAARERELKDNLLPIARQTLGVDPKHVPKALLKKLKRIITAQDEVHDGVETLGRDIERAAAALAFSNPIDAYTAERAKLKLDEDAVAKRAGEIAGQLRENALFSQIPEQEKVAQSLLEVAELLRRGAAFDDLEAIAREIDEFIERQKKINAQIEAAINKVEKALRPAELGAEQSALQRDVSEQAAALHWLAREIALFDSRTARKLDAAAREMGLGSSDLYRKALPEGLEHGKKALALLEEAREEFQSEMQQLQQAAMDAQMLEALLLLQRCLVGQKRVNRGTVKADDLRVKDDERFDDLAVKLAGDQSKVRVDARKLQKLLTQFPNAAAIVGKSGQKMDLSRIALGAGDTGKETREVQRMALALLEALIRECQSCMGGAGGARGAAMMQMMAGGSPGGFTGGANAPIMPATTDEAKNEDWRRVRSRFEEQLGAAFEARVPTKYRGLLDAYFDRLRKEPPR